MKDSPVVMNALSISAAIIVFKAVITLGQAMGWFNLSAEKQKALADFLDVAVPIIAVWLGVIWTRRNVTSLKSPRDVDNTPLTRPGDVPAIKEMEVIQGEAIELNKKVTRGLDPS